MDRPELQRTREICLALPEVTERLSHGSPTFFAGKKTMVMYLDDHHGDGRLALWAAAPPGAQAEMVDLEPERFFVPPYVGPRGWIGWNPWYGDPFWADDIDIQQIDRYEATAEIAMGKGPMPSDHKVFNAREVMSNLGPSIVRPEDLQKH